MNILITGNQGFMARNLCSYLSKNTEHNIYGFDIHENVCDFINIKWDIIYHLAAIARTYECIDTALTRAHESNVELTRYILNNMEFNKIIYSSSCAIYGDNGNISITEETKLQPKSIYASQKLLSENYVNFDCQQKQINSVCFRIFNTYGPGQSQEGGYPNVLAALIRTYKSKGYVEITGDGTQTRDFIFIDDVIRAFVLAIDLPYGNHILNVCTGIRTSINDLALKITPNIRYISERSYDFKDQVGSNDKIKKYGWSPIVDITTGIQLTLKSENIK